MIFVDESKSKGSCCREVGVCWREKGREVYAVEEDFMLNFDENGLVRRPLTFQQEPEPFLT